MRETLYAVVRHLGQWGIRVRGAEFFACDDYRVALEIALKAAALLSHHGERAGTARAGDLEQHDETADARITHTMPDDCC